MKGWIKGSAFLMMAVGTMAIETYDTKGVMIALAGMALVAACLWHDAIEDIRRENKRRNREWRARYTN